MREKITPPRPKKTPTKGSFDRRSTCVIRVLVPHTYAGCVCAKMHVQPRNTCVHMYMMRSHRPGLNIRHMYMTGGVPNACVYVYAVTQVRLHGLCAFCSHTEGDEEDIIYSGWSKPSP